MALILSSKNLGKLLWRSVLQKQIKVAHISEHEKQLIGKREIVGFGSNGQPYYFDDAMLPFPAIRWREPTCEIKALSEKEKGDWNNLTPEEKKTLYRHSFYQTFSEMKAPRHEWKHTMGWTMVHIGLAFWMYYWYKWTIYAATPLPETFCDERREHMFRRMIDLGANPVTGLASKWDYERDCWKK